jgi:VWFA-related protein
VRRLFALPLLLLFAGASREVHTVEVVQVPVYVVRDGAAVAGLTRDNFELYVNGKPQRIDYFDVYDFGATPSKPAATAAIEPEPPRDVRQRRLYVLLFDLAFSSPRALSRARAAAYEYVARAGPADVFSVGIFSAVKELQLMVPFTRDRDVVRLAIRNLKPLALEDPLHLALAPASRAELFTPAALDETTQVQQLIDDSAAHELALAPVRQRIIDETSALADFADRLAPIEGNRHVVLFTSGFNSQSVHGGGPANKIEHPISFGPNGQMDRTPNTGTGRIGMSEPMITTSIGDMNRSFNRAGVFLDCIDVEGLRLAFGSYAQSEALTMLARGTGGQVILNRNDLGEAMQTLADRQRIVYVLGFHAADTGKARNLLHVKLRGVDGRLDVTYRPSYSSELPSVPTSDGLRVADILENDIPQGGVTTSIAARGRSVDVAVPARELIALGANAEVLMYVYAGRSVVAFKDKWIAIDTARADATKPVHVVQAFDALPPGRYTAKVLVRVDGTDALGFARTPMNVE